MRRGNIPSSRNKSNFIDFWNISRLLCNNYSHVTNQDYLTFSNNSISTYKNNSKQPMHLISDLSLPYLSYSITGVPKSNFWIEYLYLAVLFISMKIKLNVKLCWLTYNFTLVVEEVMRVPDSIMVLDLKDDLKCSRHC